MCHELTTEEIRTRLLDQIRTYVDYWETIPDHVLMPMRSVVRSRLEGLAFSILVILDGGAGMMPGFIVAPLPHEDDKAYCQAEGDDWYPPNADAGDHVVGDVAGGLHELLFNQPTTYTVDRAAVAQRICEAIARDGNRVEVIEQILRSGAWAGSVLPTN